jgi:cystatin-A/B
MMMCGGFGNDKQPDEEVRGICNEIKSQVESKLNASYGTFEPLSYQTQVVAGTNFLIKVKTDNGQLKIKVHRPLPHAGPQLTLMEAEPISE